LSCNIFYIHLYNVKTNQCEIKRGISDKILIEHNIQLSSIPCLQRI